MRKIYGIALSLLFCQPLNSTILIRRAAAPPAGCSDVETTGLSAYYKYEEGSGTAVNDDSPVATHDLTLTNTPTWTTGQCGGGLSFASASSEYGTPANDPIVNTSETFTIATWFDSTQTTWGTFVSEGNTGNDTPLFECGLSGSVAGDIIFANRDDSSNSVDFSSGDVGADDGAFHFAACRQSTTASRHIYFDGVIIATNTTSIPSGRTVDITGIARLARSSDTDYFNGILDNTRIYEATAITEDQMDNIYADEN